MAELQEVRELMASALWCWGSFEKLVAELYESMASRVSDRILSLSLRWLSTESRSHSTYLEKLLELLGGARVEGCDKFIGVPWSAVESALEEVSSMERLDGDAVIEVLRKLQSTERLASKEVYSVILSNLLKDLTHFMITEAELVRVIFEEISQEEKYHERIVVMLIEYLSRGRARH